MGGAIEPITEAAMAHLGLVNRPVVAQGGIDAHIGMVGADTLAPGDVLLIGGISAVNLFLFADQNRYPAFGGLISMLGWMIIGLSRRDGFWLVLCCRGFRKRFSKLRAKISRHFYKKLPQFPLVALV